MWIASNIDHVRASSNVSLRRDISIHVRWRMIDKKEIHDSFFVHAGACIGLPASPQQETQKNFNGIIATVYLCIETELQGGTGAGCQKEP